MRCIAFFKALSHRAAQCALTLPSRGLAPASRVEPLMSNVRPHAMRKYKFQFAERFCEATERHRASKKTGVQALARAVRPASLAASARLSLLVAARASAHAVPQVTGFKRTMSVSSGFGVQVSQAPIKAVHSSANPNTGARGAGFGLLASGATQRTMRAGRVPSSARSNPSIERTNNGGSGLSAFASAQPPLFASHLKR